MTPRSGADAIDGVVDGVLRIRVKAPPVDGAANAAATRLLASVLGVPNHATRVALGATSRRKVIEVEGVDGAVLQARWPGLDV